MNREFLENYKEAEQDQYSRFEKRILEGKFDPTKERYPPNERFVKIKKPVALTTLETAHVDNIWAQIPFCGSLILPLPPWPREDFEKTLFNLSETDQIIDFIKETGRIQMVLESDPLDYVDIDFLDPFFKELEPPQFLGAPLSLLRDKNMIKKAGISYHTIAEVCFEDTIRTALSDHPKICTKVLQDCHIDYVYLKLRHPEIAEEIENLMIDDPWKAIDMFILCRMFILDPVLMFCFDIYNLAIEDYRLRLTFPRFQSFFRPQEMRFPLEIGKFLLEKLTYAPTGIRACNDLIDHYDRYDLRAILESLNEAIVTNHPDLIEKHTKDVSEILDNIWNDPQIPRLIKGLALGIPVFMAAIGNVAAGPIGAAGGFLAGLGFEVLSKAVDVGTEAFSEKAAKLFAKSYQINVFDFKKKYKDRLVKRTKVV